MREGNCWEGNGDAEVDEARGTGNVGTGGENWGLQSIGAGTVFMIQEERAHVEAGDVGRMRPLCCLPAA